jgi:hypothetical protein
MDHAAHLHAITSDHGLPSDYALKRLLGMESSGLSNYRYFRSQSQMKWRFAWQNS